MGLEESATRSAHWPAWAGTALDLRRVLRAVEAQVQPLESEWVRQETWAERRTIEHYTSQVAEWTERLSGRKDDQGQSILADRRESLSEAEGKLSAAEDKARRALRIQLVAQASSTYRRVVKGSSGELYDFLEDKSFKSLDVECPSGYVKGYTIRLTGGSEGLHLTVASRDAAWAASAHARISEEVKRSVPRWWWMRQFRVLLSFFSICFLAATFFVSIPLQKYSEGQFAYAALLGVLSGFISIALANAATFLVRFFVPAFEMIQGRPRSRGTILIFALLSGVASVGLSVLANNLL